MKIIDFNKIEVVDVKTYKTAKVKLPLNKMLDLRISVFYQELLNEFHKQLDNEINDLPLVIEIRGDVERMELIDTRDIILAALTDYMTGKEAKVQKRDELRLGTMGFDKADIPMISLMDLINYKLKVEQFEVLFYDNGNRLCKPLLSRKRAQ